MGDSEAKVGHLRMLLSPSKEQALICDSFSSCGDLKKKKKSLLASDAAHCNAGTTCHAFMVRHCLTQSLPQPEMEALLSCEACGQSLVAGQMHMRICTGTGTDEPAAQTHADSMQLGCNMGA